MSASDSPTGRHSSRRLQLEHATFRCEMEKLGAFIDPSPAAEKVLSSSRALPLAVLLTSIVVIPVGMGSA